MKIKLKLYASLQRYLPDGARDYAVELNIDKLATPNQVIRHQCVPQEMAHLVLLNGLFLDTASRETVNLKEGDTLAIWPPVAGG